jgi:hypothetical protein
MPFERARRHRRLGLGLALGASAAVAAVTLVPLPAHLGFVQYTQCGGLLRAVFEYQGLAVGFLSDQYGLAPDYCQTSTVLPGSLLGAGVFIHSSEAQGSHRLTGLSLTGPFVLTGVSPALPDTISAGGNVSLQLTFLAPAFAGNFAAPWATITAT